MVRISEAISLPLVYEDPSSGGNLLACQKLISPNRRMHDAWVHLGLIKTVHQTQTWSVRDRPRRYAFPIGLFHAPRDWMSEPGPLGYVPDAVMADARDGRVLFIMDQSQEGNASPDLWRWFYDHCHRHMISPSQVVYMTSDHLAESRHDAWCQEHHASSRMHVVSNLYNLFILNRDMRNTMDIPTWQEPVRRQWLYNCLNRVLHMHRRWLYLSLYEADLIDHGLISMDAFTAVDCIPGRLPFRQDVIRSATERLPLIVDNADFSRNMFTNLNRDIYDSSWFTIVTETYIDDEQMLFGEKVFKPMMCFSPFMLLSTAGSLARLRELGFSTFPMLWDERYDSLPIADRIQHMVDQVKKAADIKDKVSWMLEARASLIHNHKLAWTHWVDSSDWQRILAIWQRFAINSMH